MLVLITKDVRETETEPRSDVEVATVFFIPFVIQRPMFLHVTRYLHIYSLI